MTEKRQPWMKWYPADWRQEPTLRVCSRAARSLWHDMLGLMHEAEPYGYLVFAGKPMTVKQLAAILGDREKDTAKWMAELEAAGVFSRDEHGRIFSRRMVQDHDRSEEGRKWVEKRWANREDRPKPTSPPNRSPSTQKPEARSQSSDPNGSAAKPPDVASLVFTRGRLWLENHTGRPEAECRSMLGKWRKNFGDEALIAVLGAAQREAPLDAVAWIERAFQSRSQPPPKQGFNL